MSTHFVNGRWFEGTGPLLATISPVDGSPLAKLKEADLSLVDEAAIKAKSAFDAWSSMHFVERVERLIAFKILLTKEKETISLTISKETGKPLWESMQEAQSMIDKITLAKIAFKQRCRPAVSYAGNYPVKTLFKPKGALAVLGPFNFPGHLPNGHIIPALIAGNTIVYKPSEKTPLTGKLYTELMEQAKLPPGVFNMVQGGKNIGEALARSPHLNGLLFTGSHQAGLSLSKIFADHPYKILALEMGGNNPLIIDEVQDMRFACYIAIQSAFLSSGQRCSCARRLIVQNGPFAEEFLSMLSENAERLEIGSPFEEKEHYMGPLISVEAVTNLLTAQENLLALGGKSILVAKKHGQNGAFVTPGIIDVTSIKDRPDEEYFGPFLQVRRVNSFQEALEEANNTRFGLTASLVSEKRHHFELFEKKVHAGILNWNTPTTGGSSRSSFGGLKESGNNRASAFFAADYCSSPIASMETEFTRMPTKLPPGIYI